MYGKKVEALSTTPQSFGVSYKKVVPDLKKKKRSI